MDSALWIGAATGLAGAAVGGAISYLVSVQQIREAHAQRVDTERSDQARRSLDRRLAAYADFLTHARRFRNALRPSHHHGAGLRVPVAEIDALARSADAAASLVFLVAESTQTEAACGAVMRTIGQTIDAIHDGEADPDHVPWDEVNGQMARKLREFRTATRAELHIHGINLVPSADPRGSLPRTERPHRRGSGPARRSPLAGLSLTRLGQVAARASWREDALTDTVVPRRDRAVA